MRYILLFLIYSTTLMSLSSCGFVQRTFSKAPPASQVVDVDSLNFTPQDSAQLAGLGIYSKRLSAKKLLLIPYGTSGDVKIKNSFNTDNSQKKSNNDESITKDKSKVKGSGNTDSNNTARQGAVVGDNSTASQKKGIAPWLLLLGGIILLVLFVLYLLHRAKSKVLN